MSGEDAFDWTGHGLIALTLFFTLYGQLVLKWQMGMAGDLPTGGVEWIGFLLRQFLNPWILSGYVSALLASVSWMAAMTRFDLSYAYPFMSLAFILVMGFSIAFLGETMSVAKLLGTLMVVGGIIVVARA